MCSAAHICSFLLDPFLSSKLVYSLLKRHPHFGCPAGSFNPTCTKLLLKPPCPLCSSPQRATESSLQFPMSCLASRSLPCSCPVNGHVLLIQLWETSPCTPFSLSPLPWATTSHTQKHPPDHLPVSRMGPTTLFSSCYHKSGYFSFLHENLQGLLLSCRKKVKPPTDLM